MSGIGDIELNGKKYRLDFQTWREKDIIDFAPRATVPTGSVVMSDLNLYQPLVQTDWRHGQGFHWYEDASGYLSTTGNVDTRQDGLAMLFTKATSSDTNNNVKNGMTAFNGAIYTWGAAGLRKYDGAVWTSVYSTAAVNFALATGDYLFFCPDGLRILKMDTSGTITNAGLDANATDFKWLIIHNGFIFAGKDGTNQVHYDNNADLSALEGTTADLNIIYCGIGNKATIRGFVYAAVLYVERPDGLWTIGDDHIARRVIDYSNEESANNFRGSAVLNGYLVFSIRDRVIQWNGARVSDITPSKITDIFPYVMYGEFNNFVVVNNFLYCTGKTNEPTYSIDLLCYDGVGWHKMMNLVSNGTDTITMVAYDVVNNRLWYHLNAASDATYYIPLQNQSSFPYPDFPTTGTHSLISSRLDMGFRRVKKSMASLIVEARNCSATCYLSVYYQIDGDGTWTKWTDIKQSGIQEFFDPGSFKTREFNYINLRFDFVTASATQSPILEGYTVRFIMRPDTLLGFNFWIVGVSSFQSGMAEDERTASEIRRELLVCRNSKPPVLLVGLEGDEHWGYLTSFQGQPMFRKDAGDEYANPDDIEWRFQCNFVEVG